MNVLSVFDGMSCGQVALERAGIPYDNYFASEIDKYAIQISNKNYPNTIQLGTIENWREWTLPKIDLFIGGSPCQGFSNAGLGLNFDDPRSKLFFTYVDILKSLRERNPDLIFLLENVRMKKAWRDIITDLMGVDPIEINSALVSAQNRKRLYWTNVDGVDQPEDRHIYLKDILEDDLDYVKTDKKFNPKTNQGKASCVTGGAHSGGNHSDVDILIKGAALRNQVTKRGIEAQLNVRKDNKSNCVVPGYAHKLNGLVQIGSIGEGRQGERIYSVEGKRDALSSSSGGVGKNTGLYQVGIASDVNGHDCVKRVYSMIGKSRTLTNMQGGQRQPKVLIRRNGHGFVPTEIKEVEKSDTLREATQHNYHIRKKSKTVRVGASNSPVGSKQEWDLISKEDYRRLSVIECERLQTLPDGYTEGVSNTQRYKMIGNGWTIEVIAHIFRNIKVAEPLD
jgi:DNA (cytosine-5)-methyltransferase 3A